LKTFSYIQLPSYIVFLSAFIAVIFVPTPYFDYSSAGTAIEKYFDFLPEG
jgi:hypothetical protein